MLFSLPLLFRSRLLLALFLLGLLTQRSAAQGGGNAGPVTLRGTAFDSKTGEPLIGATIRLMNTTRGTATGLDGSFVLRDLPTGPVTVQCQSVGFAPQQLDVTLGISPVQILAFRLTAIFNQLAEVAVMGQADRESENASRHSEQKADNVLNIISSHAIELSPDITVGNVLQRASGVSVVRNSSGDGQYAIIRGMDRRYNYTLVNGIKIPSPDPKNRYVPLDIFPAELLERLEVVKALTPNMEGDAIGGAMNLVMKAAPDHLVVAATASTGYSDLFSARAFSNFSTAGLATQSPGEAHTANYVATASDFSQKQLNYTRAVPINALLGLTLGNRTKDGKFGILLAGSYQRTFRGGNSLYYQPLGQPKPEPNPNTFTFDEVQRREYSTLQTRSGLHAKLDYVFSPSHRISLYSMGLQLDEAQHRQFSSNDLGIPGDVPYSDRSRFQRQHLFNETLQGDHVLVPGVSLNWSGVYSLATSEVPDQITANYVDRTAANTPQGKFLRNITHLWTHSRDQDWAGYLNLSYAFRPWLDLTAGGMARTKHRSNFYDYYALMPVTDGSAGSQQVYHSYGSGVYNVDSNDNGEEKSTDGNNYSATESITAGYAQVKLIVNELQIVGGLRAENTLQTYTSQLPPTEEGKAGRISYLDLLPSVHFKYRLDKQQNLRLSYFKGISRPGYFELIPAPGVNGGDYYTETGNFRLKHTQADNLDLRYELFGPTNAQLLGGVFYKHLVNPIEYGFAQVGNDSYYYQPQNFGNATNYGGELVFMKYLRNWGLSGNYTYTHSSITTTKRVYYRSGNGQLVTASEGQPTLEYPTPPTQTRPLQGQSNHIANLALLYRNEAHGLHAQLAAVYTGRRINIVSPYKDLDQWQRATTQLDFSAEKSLPNHLTVFAKVTNLLNTPIIVEIMQAPNPALLTLPEQTRADRTLVQRDEFKRTYQFGLRYRLN